MASNILTPEECETVRNASKYCSLETKQLLEIVRRLVKMLVEPMANPPKYFTTILDDDSMSPQRSLFSDLAIDEIRQIAREEIRRERERNTILGDV